jgi:uncharacterized RDD family membrane protein YckC
MPETTGQTGAIMPDAPLTAPRYAGFRDRLYASFVDMLLMFLLVLAFFPNAGMPDHPPEYFQAQYSMMEKQFHAGEITEGQLTRKALALTLEATNVAELFWQTLLLGALVIIFWQHKGATPGKMVFRMKVVDAETLGKPSAGQFVIRYLAYALSALPLGLGFFAIGWSKRKQGWHDKLSRTVVIHTRPLEPDWQKKRFKRQTIMAILLVLGFIIYNRLIRQ